MKAIREAVIVAYGRAPVARAGKGALAFERPTKYAAEVLQGVLKRVEKLDPADIDDVIIGCAKPEDVQGSNVAKIICQRAGLPDSVPAQTVNRYCSSGLQTIAMAANAIMADQADIIVAGGVETMTMIPIGGGDISARDPWLVKHRPDAYISMGLTAENVAEKYGVTREEMDRFSVRSHLRAAKAQKDGAFEKEIIPVTYTSREGEKKLHSEDEGIRPESNLESLAKLRAAFKENGSVTAGNSSQTDDGAGFVVVMSAEAAEQRGIKPIARFLGFSVAGVDPALMGTGPMEAVPKLLKRIGMTVDQFDVIELNEAFASQAIACIRELGMDEEKVNPRGGAIALGHPLGATGANLTCKALSYLEDTKGKYALVSMCIGGGMGAAGAFEMI